MIVLESRFFNNERHEKARNFLRVVALADEIACEFTA